MFHVIIAGGLGTRFWPKSTKDKPKQHYLTSFFRMYLRSFFINLLKN